MSGSNPLISVMISAWNQSDVLPSAIDSVLAQDYPHIEIIVSDDASGDPGLDSLMEKYNQSNIRWVIQNENLGRAGNYRSLLYSLARGKYVTLLNADDFFMDPHYFRVAIDLLESEQEIQLVFGDVSRLITATGQEIDDTFHEDLPSIVDGNKFFFDYPVKGYSIPHVSSVYRRERAIEIGFYRIDSMSQDWESLLRIILNAKLGYIDHVVATKRQHASNVTKTKEIGHFRSNEKWIQGVCEYALESGLDRGQVEHWRNRMLRRHHFKWLVKMEYLAPGLKPDYLKFLAIEHPELYNKVVNSLKYRLFILVNKSDFLMRIIFKYLIKQESFIVDLQQYRQDAQKLHTN